MCIELVNYNLLDAREKERPMLAIPPRSPAPITLRHLLLGAPTSTRCVCSHAG